MIDDLLACLESFGANDEDRLKELIPDATYRRNFIGLAERLAPDGEQVRVVGLTVLREGEERRVSLVKEPRDPPARRTADKSSSDIVGRLLFADGTSDRKHIKIIDEHGESHTLIVPEGMMADIVKPLWEDVVKVYVVKRGKSNHLDASSGLRSRTMRSNHSAADFSNR